MNIKGEKNPVSYGEYSLSEGVFGLETVSGVYWLQCRELFHNDIRSIGEGYYFCHTSTQRTNLAKFIYLLETHLGIKEKTTFTPTSKQVATWVAPAKWWLTQLIRHNFFTVALRAGCNYNPEIMSWHDTLLSYKYCQDTPYATKRFLMGFTQYNGSDTHIVISNVLGWKKRFECETNEAIDKLLILPTEDKERYSAIEKIAIDLANNGRKISNKEDFWLQAATMHSQRENT